MTQENDNHKVTHHNQETCKPDNTEYNDSRREQKMTELVEH